MNSQASNDSNQSVYDAVGGDEFFVELVDHFYAGVEDDPLIRPLYPEEDLGGAKHRLSGFLIQYWGGPTSYSDDRGHPRLRMRHAPFQIGVAERDAWLGHMGAALDAMGPEPHVRAQFDAYFEMAATRMINHIPAPERPDGARSLGLDGGL